MKGGITYIKWGHCKKKQTLVYMAFSTKLCMSVCIEERPG